MDFIMDFTSAIFNELVDEGVKYVNQVSFCMQFIPSSITYLLVIIINLFIADRAYMYWKMKLQEKKMDAFIEGKSETTGMDSLSSSK